MASEITISASISVSKGGASISGSGTLASDMSGDQMITNVQTVGTSWEAINLGDISTIGPLFCKNQSASNYVELALANDGTEIFAKLVPNAEPSIFRPVTTTLYARANTSSCNVIFSAAEA